MSLTLIPEHYHHKLMRMMYLIREVEEEIARRYPEGNMRCPTHLSIGQEGVPAVLSVLLDHQDVAMSTHRSHAHYLAKGGNLKAMLAEIYGRQGGCSGGRGGSMHLIDESVGFKGSTAIVGNTIPMGVGLGLAIKIRQQPFISVIFVGDGAIEEGVFYEAANFAVVKQLPVLFVCENNLYSVYSSIKPRQPENRSIHQMVSAIGLSVQAGDGNDLTDCFPLLDKAVNAARAGEGPQFVELATYRWREHCGPHYDNDLGYRTEAEFLSWQDRDPLHLFEQQLIGIGNDWNDAVLKSLRKEVRGYVLSAFEYAESQPFPDKSEVHKYLYRETHFE